MRLYQVAIGMGMAALLAVGLNANAAFADVQLRDVLADYSTPVTTKFSMSLVDQGNGQFGVRVAAGGQSIDLPLSQVVVIDSQESYPFNRLDLTNSQIQNGKVNIGYAANGVNNPAGADGDNEAPRQPQSAPVLNVDGQGAVDLASANLAGTALLSNGNNGYLVVLIRAPRSH